MNDQINLLSHKRKQLFTRDALLHLVQLLARVFLVATVLASITLFILNSSGRLNILQQQDKTISTNLSFLQQRIIKFLLIRERLGNIDNILKTKSNVDIIISDIATALPTDVSVNTFTLSQHTISLVMTSSSLPNINTFLDLVIEKVNKKEWFKSVTVTSLSTDTNGVYSLNLTAQY